MAVVWERHWSLDEDGGQQEWREGMDLGEVLGIGQTGLGSWGKEAEIVRNWLAPFTEVETWEVVSGRGVRREDEDLCEGQEGVSRT